MIVRPRLHWFRMLIVMRGSVLLDITPQMVLTTAFAVLVTASHDRVFAWKVPLNFVPFSLIGVTLAIILGFRNNTSYARYSEARALWGSVMIESRTLLRQSVTLLDDLSQGRALMLRLIAFSYALRHQLRGTDAEADLARLLTAEDCARLRTAQFKPAVLLLMIGEWLREMRERRLIEPVLMPAMEVPLGHLGVALGGCERLASTPIPFPYAVIIHRTVYVYCFLLPFGLFQSIGVATPVLVAFIAYTFFSLEALSAELEEPFGTAPNDLALDSMCWTTEATLREMLEDRDVPMQPRPVNYVLL